MTADLPLCHVLAQRVTGYRLERADEALVRAAKTAIADTLAVTLLGSRAPAARIARAVGCEPGGAATVVGTRQRSGILGAAFANGVAAHCMDFDDFTEGFGGHPSVPIVPGLLALAEMRGACGVALLEAYVAGVELETRLAAGVHFHHYEKGWHPTATLGVFGGAAAACRLLELDAARTGTALAIAASLASGLKANFGTMTKPLHVGHTARSALLAALLAEARFDANLQALEHRQGFLEVYNGPGTYRIDAMLGTWFDPPAVLEPGISLKQFACCGSTHPAIYMALALRDRGIAADRIERVSVRTHPRRLPHTDNPDPRSGLEAKFSIQYCVARALLSGPPRLAHFDDAAVRERAVRALMSRVEVAAHPEMAGDDAGCAFGAEVEIALRDGTSQAARVEHLPGRGPGNPMSDDELYEKFSDCARAVLAPPETRALWHGLSVLETLDDVAPLLRLTAAPAPPLADSSSEAVA